MVCRMDRVEGNIVSAGTRNITHLASAGEWQKHYTLAISSATENGNSYFLLSGFITAWVEARVRICV